MKPKLYLLPALILFSCMQLTAQDQPADTDTKEQAAMTRMPMNILKVNLIVNFQLPLVYG